MRAVCKVMSLIVAALVLYGSTAIGQAPAASCARMTREIPTVLTVEGGGSLGVYEAGVSHVLVELYKRKRLRTDTTGIYCRLGDLSLTAATGASAGNINGFLAAMTWCDSNVSGDPEQSVFWQTWVSTGLTQLLPAKADDASTPHGVFSRRHFDGYLRNALLGRWRRAKWISGCAIDFGATVTRLRADSVVGVGSIKARNQRMASAFTISGIDSGGHPIVSSLVPQAEGAFGAIAPLPPRLDTVTGRFRVSFNQLFNLIETSSGYPVAFEPLPLEYCAPLLSPADPERPGACGDSTNALALDGGVFDNGPIALAYALAFERRPGVAPIALYLSPDHRRIWPGQTLDALQSQAHYPARAPYGLEEVSQLLAEAFPTARQYELQLAGKLLPRDLAIRAMERDLASLTARGIATGDSLRAEIDRTGAALAVSERRAQALQAMVQQLCKESMADTLGTSPPSAVCSDSARMSRVSWDSPPIDPHLISLSSDHAYRPDTSSSRTAAAQPEHSLALTQTVEVRKGIATAADSLADRFRTTARWHPLAGDWLMSFGAFLGRPLREYDFYVGVYDGFVLVAENVECDSVRREIIRRDTSSAWEGYKSCVGAALASLIRNPPVPVGLVGAHLLRALYHDEFNADVDALLSAPMLDTDMSAADSTFVVLDAIRRAMNAARMKPVLPTHGSRAKTLKQAAAMKQHCAQPGIAGAVFCDSRLIAFFDKLAAQQRAVHILERRAEAVGCRKAEAWMDPDGCSVEPRFVEMVRDPEGALNTLTREALARLEVITPRGGTPRRMASALLFFHGSTTDRHRRGWDLGPNSLPLNLNRAQNIFFHLVPNTATLTPNIAAWGEYGWEVRRHAGTWPLALGFPLRLRPFSEIGADSAGLRSLVIPGVSLEYKGLPYNSRVALQVDRWLRPHDGWREMDRGTSKGFFGSIGGKFAFSLTGVPKGLPLFRQSARIRPRGRPAVLSVGFDDVNGMLYWSWRVLRG